MFPRIIVFVDKPTYTYQARILNSFIANDYAPFADAVHKRDRGWFVKNMVCPHRLFKRTSVEEFEAYTIKDWDEEERMWPDFAVYYNEDDVVDDLDWAEIVDHFITIVKGAHDLMIVHPKLFEKPVKQLSFLQDAQIAEMPDTYSFHREYYKEKDIMIYEVLKPNTDRPYTTLVRDFSNRGHRRFFSNLYHAKSWGTCNEDHDFLKYCWKMLEMEGECDLEMMLKEHIEACNPNNDSMPEVEPEVFRDTLDFVRMKLERKRKFND